jgi:hypothetical protein
VTSLTVASSAIGTFSLFEPLKFGLSGPGFLAPDALPSIVISTPGWLAFGRVYERTMQL